jgi:membrane fusion protein, multidrug efflux system
LGALGHYKGQSQEGSPGQRDGAWAVGTTMKKQTWVLWGIILAGLAAAAWVTKPHWAPDGAVAQAPRGQQSAPRAVPVEVATAVKKSVPVRIEALGTVTPIANVAIKSRLETDIVAVHFADGALVNEGDVLFTLDNRTLQAQIRQAEGILARDKAQLEAAERDIRRYTELVAKNATPITNLDNAKTQADTARANIKADEAALENLNVQLSYTTIRAPISGRISAAMVKTGNFVRPSDVAPLATINQIAPIYVSFGLPQRILPEVRDAMAESNAAVEAIVPGENRRATGRLTMIENTVESATGMVTLRATMDNKNELLWPGTLVTAQLTLRVEQAVTIPNVAVQVGQSANFVYVIQDGVASVRPVKVARTLDREAVIESGLEDAEVVVTDGQLLLTNGSRVAVREPKAGT